MPLAKAIPVAIRQQMWSAFQELEKTITPQDSKDFATSTLQKVRKEALDIETRLAARQSLRNMRRLMPLFTALEHYAKSADTLCNGTPLLPWVWAPITLILRVASEYVEAFDQIIKGYTRIAESLQHIHILSEAFAGDDEFHRVLAIFYADILEFHKHAYKFVRRSGWKILFLTSWGRFQRRFDNIIEEMKRHESLIDQEASSRNIFEAQAMRQELRVWKEESLEKINQLDKEQSAKEFQGILSWLRVNECDQLAIFESVSSQGNKYPGTCSWTHQNAKIRSWLQQTPDTPFLWLSGTAGSGKSVISTQLINFMRIAKKNALSHFCTYSSAASSEYDHILKSLLEQLLRQDGDLTAHVYNEYVLKKQSATISSLENLLQDLLMSSSNDLSKTHYIWIVVDGVDELREEPPNSQARLSSLLKQIVSKTSAPGNVVCKVLLSSRPTPTLSQAFRRKPTVLLTEEKKCLSMAIEDYACQRLRSIHMRFEQLGISSREIDDIGQQISRKADGMFLYARLVLDFISSNLFIRGEELRNSINQLPRELSNFYRKIVSQIVAPLDSDSVDHIKCIFGWIAFAKRPLRVSELLSAVAFSDGDPDIDLPAPSYILDICGSLIEERSDGTISFIHVSVKEHLQSPLSNLGINEKVALNQHCLATVTCLLSGFRLYDEDIQKRYRPIVKGTHALHVYASLYWIDYLLCMIDPPGGLDVTSKLHTLLDRLCTELDKTSQDQSQANLSEASTLEPRLVHLEKYGRINKVVKQTIYARSLQHLERRLHFEIEGLPHIDSKVSSDAVSALLAQYQKILTDVIQEIDIPGIAAQELEDFKKASRSSAYTCRLGSCDRATVGFETERQRAEHEIGHVRQFRCTYLLCPYPPFLSAQALRRHVSGLHNLAPPKRRAIRQNKDVRSLSETGRDKSTTFGTRRHMNTNSSSHLPSCEPAIDEKQAAIISMYPLQLPEPRSATSPFEPTQPARLRTPLGSGSAGLQGVNMELSATMKPNIDSPVLTRVYEFHKDYWTIRNTGYCTLELEPLLERLDHGFQKEAEMVVKSPTDLKTIFKVKLCKERTFEKTHDTIIRWREPPSMMDMLLRFQDAIGCSMIWDMMNEIQNTTKEINRMSCVCLT